MATLTAFIVSKLEAAGFVASDLVAVRWFDEDARRWRDLAQHQAKDAFDAVQVAAVSPSARSRLSFMAKRSDQEVAEWMWSNAASDFERIPRDHAFTLSASDLTG